VAKNLAHSIFSDTLPISQIRFKLKVMTKSFLITTIFMAFSAVFNGVKAQDKNLYTLDKSIELAGNDGYDYLFVDEKERKLYVSHGTKVHILDLNTEQVIGTIDSLGGIHGVAVVNKRNRGFISDGKINAVHVFDLKTLKIVKTIPVKGKKTDAIMYDAHSNQVFAFNNGSDNASVIDPDDLKEIKTIALNGAPEFGVSDGKGLVFNNIEDRNTLDIIDTKTLTVLDSIALSPCGTPTGLAIDKKNKRIFTVCRENKGMSVVNMDTKKVIATLPICSGVDAVVYDEKTKLIFCSGDGTTTIIQQETADKYAVVQTLKTGTRAKTMALDKKTHKIYISVANYENKKIVPNTFRLLVYKMN
jgi:DNA-binding beta-propeller fold protein YncE